MGRCFEGNSDRATCAQAWFCASNPVYSASVYRPAAIFNMEEITGREKTMRVPDLGCRSAVQRSKGPAKGLPVSSE